MIIIKIDIYHVTRLRMYIVTSINMYGIILVLDCQITQINRALKLFIINLGGAKWLSICYRL